MNFPHGFRYDYDTFDSLCDLKFANFSETISFYAAQFNSGAEFFRATFDSTTEVSFFVAQFSKGVEFRNTEFRHGVSFERATFDSSSYAAFHYAQFSGRVDFTATEFGNVVRFYQAVFDNSTYVSFNNAQFCRYVGFKDTKFRHGVSFKRAVFDSTGNVKFIDAQFSGDVGFQNAEFKNGGFIMDAVFDSTTKVSFSATRFSDQINFSRTRFLSGVDFDSAVFDNGAIFRDCVIGDSTFTNDKAMMSFRNAETGGILNFTGSTIYYPMDFRGMKFESKSSNKVIGLFDSGTVDLNLEYLSEKQEPWALFHNARIFDTIHIGTKGTWDPQYFDFSLALFPDERIVYKWEELKDSTKKDSGNEVDSTIDTLVDDSAFTDLGNEIDSVTEELVVDYSFAVEPAIILYGPVKLKMQMEKFRYLSFYDSLSYYEKKNIVEHLKQNSYAGDEYKKERFELDYFFARATAYDKVSTSFQKYEWYSLRRLWRWLYGATLGYGYRPFWLFYWAFGIAIFFAFLYYFLRKGEIRNEIGIYIRNLAEPERLTQDASWHSKPEAWYYCFWFSVTVLLSIRLKPKLLVAFNAWQKRFILTEYVIGLLLYAYFIIFSKAGSIGMTFVQLFTG